MPTRPFVPVFAGLALLAAGCAPDRVAGPSTRQTKPDAIVYGSPDVANTYSNVGAFIVRAPNGRFAPICSGTLVAPTTFLTAAHCTSYFSDVLEPNGFTAYVSFRNVIAYGALADAPTIASLIPVIDVITNPNYSQQQSDVGDLGLLILNAAPGPTPATLPSVGLLDDLNTQNGLKGATFTVAGYGVQDRITGGGTPFFTDANPLYRGYSAASFLALNNGYLRLSQNPATGDGGACYGDSGGPNFLSVSGQQVLVAVTITGDAVCRATNVVYRLDIPSARAFLDSYLP